MQSGDKPLQGPGSLSSLTCENVGILCLKSLVVEKIITLLQETGKYNVADLGTKHVDAKTLSRIIDKIGYAKVDGRTLSALRHC